MTRAAQIFTQEVLPLFEVNRAQWLDVARKVAINLGRGGAHVTIDDVREKCPPPVNFDPRLMGAVFRDGNWTNVGYRQSERTKCHGRPIGVFRLKPAKQEEKAK